MLIFSVCRMLQIAKYARRIAFLLCLCSHICSLFFALCARYMLVFVSYDDVCLVSYNVLHVCHRFSVTLNKKDIYTDLQTTIVGLMGTRLLSVTLCVITSGPFVAPRQFVSSHSATHHQNNNDAQKV